MAAPQEHGFKAEVQQLLNLMIHSVYSDREVFLRELVSNAADALDRVRFLALTDKELVDAAAEEPGIRITVSSEDGTIVIEDDGVGMTEDEVIQNLGTIAHSGTKAFLEQVSGSEGAPDLIGQFGLGFYSAFMVADEVEVETRSARQDATPVKWSSKGAGTYAVEKGTREHRGTRITMILREDSTDFSESERISGIVRKHSNFLPWPILVDGEQANSGKALWTEAPSQVTDEEANAFYKTVAMDWQDPALRVHLKVDSPLQYSAMLFVPSARPFDLFHPEAPRGPRLYAKRILIEEHARELLPEWLRFVRGVVDSEDIQLNVSREMVQKTPVMRKIRDALTKRILKDLNKFAKANEEGAYDQIWRDFGALLKEGFYHARDAWGDRLLPLFRFNTVSHDDDKGLMSLAEYREQMPEDQDTIWFMAAESRAAALASPHLEAFKKKGWNVLLYTETVDEWLTQILTEFEDIPVKSISRGELDIEEDDEDDAEKADLKAFTPWIKDILGEQISEVRASTRLTDSACVLVDADQGVSANMERILRAANQDVMTAQRVLELNPKHPLIKNLAALHDKGMTDEAEPLVRVLLDDALLLEGTVKEPAAMGRRLQDLLMRASAAALK
jgi:molecular chaperone HtpG